MLRADGGGRRRWRRVLRPDQAARERQGTLPISAGARRPESPGGRGRPVPGTRGSRPCTFADPPQEATHETYAHSPARDHESRGQAIIFQLKAKRRPRCRRACRCRRRRRWCGRAGGAGQWQKVEAQLAADPRIGWLLEATLPAGGPARPSGADCQSISAQRAESRAAGRPRGRATDATVISTVLVQTASEHYVPLWGMKPTVLGHRKLLDLHMLTRTPCGLLTRRRAALGTGQGHISQTRSSSFPTRVKDVGSSSFLVNTR